MVTLTCCPCYSVLQAHLTVSSHLAVQDLPDSESALPLQGRGAETRTGTQDDHPQRVFDGHAREAARCLIPAGRADSPPGGDQEVAGAGLSGEECTDDRELLHQDIQKGRPWLDSGLCTSANDGAHVTCLCGCCSKVDQCLWRLLWLTRLRAFAMLVEAVLFTAGTC